jgi:hypothetical protein
MAPGKPPQTHCRIQSYVIQWTIGLILHRFVSVGAIWAARCVFTGPTSKVNKVPHYNVINV